jgi:hypothetical protein
MSTPISIRRIFRKFTDFFQKERGRLTVFSALILVGIVSFEAGFLAGGSTVSLPLSIEKPIATTPDQGAVAGVSTTSAKEMPPVVVSMGARTDCTFVGSRNSTLYHLPTCAPAKRIKPENIVCFVSSEDAEKRGYKAGCLK